MKKNLFLFSTLLAAAFASLPLAGASVTPAEYSVDASHSRVGFTVRHIVSKVTGKFNEFEGTFTFDAKKPELAKVEFAAKAKSIDTDHEKRDEHLRSADFFDTDQHKELKFVSKKFTSKGKNKFKLEGDLTIRGVTKPATFDVEFLGEDKDPWGGIRAGFTASTKINRKDFGIVWNKTLDSGGVLVGDDVQITLEIEAVKKVAAK